MSWMSEAGGRAAFRAALGRVRCLAISPAARGVANPSWKPPPKSRRVFRLGGGALRPGRGTMFVMASLFVLFVEALVVVVLLVGALLWLFFLRHPRPPETALRTADNLAANRRVPNPWRCLPSGVRDLVPGPRAARRGEGPCAGQRPGGGLPLPQCGRGSEGGRAIRCR